MSTYDVMVRGGTVVLPDGPVQTDLAIADQRIVALSPELAGSAREEIDARGRYVFPGVVDAHVHFNEPGRAEWEGFAAGTRALAAGGTTTFCDMPLNAHPPTLDGASFDLKHAAARAASLVDFALWGGLVPGPMDRLAELAARGVVGLKAFMSDSGIDDFPMVDDLTLYEGMRRAAQLGLLVAVHAENDQLTAGLAQRAIAEGRTGVRDYLASRPVVAELEAIARAITFATETSCRLHIVHISSGRGVALVAQARAQGVDVSCETCPHYLVLTDEDVEHLGAVAKCAPPLRPQAEQDALWAAIAAGALPMVASDHSPAPPAMKIAPSFFKAWGGISGCQHLLALMLTDGYDARQVPLARIAALTAGYPAERFGLAQKGQIAVGHDADLVLAEPGARIVVQSGDLLYRHQHSPYVGRTLGWRIVRTLLRGTTVCRDGQIVAEPLGRLMTPHQAKSAT